jgi:nucleotide-binding universal stress UspA family protein
MKISNILVPTDFSACSDQALDYAIELASKLDARIHVLTVIGIPAYGVPELGVGVTASRIDSLVSDNQTALEKVAHDRKLGTPGMVRVGDARDVILQTAEELNADLIVMGSRHGIARVARQRCRNDRTDVADARPYRAG